MLDLGLSGAIVLITGGASGIGAACAKAFAAEKCHIVILDCNRSAGEKMEADIDLCRFIETDITSDIDVSSAIELIMAEYGKLDVVLCCAGISGPVGKNICDIESAQWERVMAVNLGGIYRTARFCIPALLQSPIATMLVIASDSSFLAYPGMSVYSASKGGVLMLVKALAVDHPDLRINCLCPSLVETPMAIADLGLDGDTLRKMGVPVILPSQLATHALFLASPISAPINGASLVVDFGYMARPAFPQPAF